MTNRLTALRRSLRNEQGSVALELVILWPGLILFILLLIYAGRISSARGVTDQAAADAARVASLARTAGAARIDAEDAARDSFAAQGLSCQRVTVVVNTAGFRVPVGQPANVSATVTCVVRLSDLGPLPVPASRGITTTVTSPLDRYRERA